MAAAFLGSAGGAASLASVFGASTASLSGWKYSRRLAEIRVFEFVHISSNYVIDAIASCVNESTERKSSISRAFPLDVYNRKRSKYRSAHQPPFAAVIGISGWLKTLNDATEPWVRTSRCATNTHHVHTIENNTSTHTKCVNQKCVNHRLGTEVFALKWEPQLLTELGTMMIRLVGEVIYTINKKTNKC